MDDNLPEQGQQPVPLSQNPNLKWYALAIVCGLIGLMLGYYLGRTTSIAQRPTATITPTRVQAIISPIAASSTSQPATNKRFYSNGEYSFTYPEGWDVYPRDNAAVIVAPQNRIKEMKSMGSFEGGAILTVTMGKFSQPTLASDYVTDETKTVATKDILIDGQPAKQHTITYLVDQGAVRKGEGYIANIIPYNKQDYFIELLDSTYSNEFQQIVASFKFEIISGD